MITLLLKKQYRTLKPNFTFTFKPGLNYLVGKNGSGKTSLTERLLSYIHRAERDKWENEGRSYTYQERKESIINEHYYRAFTTQEEGIRDIECTGIETLDFVYIISPQVNHTAITDMDASFALGGIERIWMSSGQSMSVPLMEMLKHKDNENALIILDEPDVHLDIEGKFVYFKNILPQIKGTCIVISHDLFFLSIVPEVLDLDTYLYRTGMSYVKAQEGNYISTCLCLAEEAKKKLEQESKPKKKFKK